MGRSVNDHLSREIVVGEIRIPFAPEYRNAAGVLIFAASWVLPGGERTISFERAHNVANQLALAVAKMKPPITTKGTDDSDA